MNIHVLLTFKSKASLEVSCSRLFEMGWNRECPTWLVDNIFTRPAKRKYVSSFSPAPSGEIVVPILGAVVKPREGFFFHLDTYLNHPVSPNDVRQKVEPHELSLCVRVPFGG